MGSGGWARSGIAECNHELKEKRYENYHLGSNLNTQVNDATASDICGVAILLYSGTDLGVSALHATGLLLHTSLLKSARVISSMHP